MAESSPITFDPRSPHPPPPGPPGPPMHQHDDETVCLWAAERAAWRSIDVDGRDLGSCPTVADPTPTLADVEALALLLRPWTTCDDGGRFDHGSLAAAQSVLSSEWLAAREAAARTDERERLLAARLACQVERDRLMARSRLAHDFMTRDALAGEAKGWGGAAGLIFDALAQPADTEGA